MADVTYEEMGKLCGLTRQSLHTYLNDPYCYMEDTPNGRLVIEMSKKLATLVSTTQLPLPKMDKDEKIEKLKELTS